MRLCIPIRVPKFLKRSKEPEWVSGICDQSMVSSPPASTFSSIIESIVYPTPVGASLRRTVSYHTVNDNDYGEPQGTVHLLSIKSTLLERDTFIFWATPECRLLLGLNQKRTPVTHVTLLRWIRLVDPEIDEFHVQPVLLERRGILNYFPSPMAGPTPDPSSRLLPGDYLWVDPSTAQSGPRPLLAKRSSLSSYRAKHSADKDPVSGATHELYTFPPSFEQSVASRDGWRCFITGEEASPPEKELALTWLFPPAWKYRLLCQNGRTSPPVEDFVSTSNVGLIRKDLISLFNDNAFGVDVDDDYRLVIFRDLGPNVQLAQRQQGISPGPDGRFLREHFRWCLVVHLLGGDVREDYHVDDVAGLAQELGLLGETDEDVVQLEDERWQSALGRELFEHHLSYKFSL
ncbi:hypothetical protein Hypma_002366 [Hypsizygus marmoreus]|uniref:HNH nuclease domain-containing protein n=1 Tax=Hypsizygus marmoreus TaxID=39966 RepID=A0A369J7R9_HYPMA|nr:hypothetical protein Hypma_002366 [Hypsizygus marmoreus]